MQDPEALQPLSSDSEHFSPSLQKHLGVILVTQWYTVTACVSFPSQTVRGFTPLPVCRLVFRASTPFTFCCSYVISFQFYCKYEKKLNRSSFFSLWSEWVQAESCFDHMASDTFSPPCLLFYSNCFWSFRRGCFQSSDTHTDACRHSLVTFTEGCSGDQVIWVTIVW